MLQNVTWDQFFYLSSLLLAAYYVVIGLIYYRDELFAIVKGKRKIKTLIKPMPAPAVVNFSAVSSSYGEEEDELEFSAGDLDDKERLLFSDADSLNDELADLFYVCKCEEWTKDELTPLIQKKLRQYPHFASSSFASSFVSYIVDKAQEDCGMQFTYEEVQALW